MNLVLADWSFTAEKNIDVTVFPDGCRDLIVQYHPEAGACWFISPLQARTRRISITERAYLQGFRLRPGTYIDEAALLASLPDSPLSDGDVADRIDCFSHLLPSVYEALECLAGNPDSVASAARRLGVSQRSLQRLMVRETGFPPVFWLRLARVRLAARAITQLQPLAEIAYTFGYSDQAHMTREFGHWLDSTPARLRQESELSGLLDSSAYP